MKKCLKNDFKLRSFQICPFESDLERDLGLGSPTARICYLKSFLPFVLSLSWSVLWWLFPFDSWVFDFHLFVLILDLSFFITFDNWNRLFERCMLLFVCELVFYGLEREEWRRPIERRKRRGTFVKLGLCLCNIPIIFKELWNWIVSSTIKKMKLPTLPPHIMKGKNKEFLWQSL